MRIPIEQTYNELYRYLKEIPVLEDQEPTFLQVIYKSDNIDVTGSILHKKPNGEYEVEIVKDGQTERIFPYLGFNPSLENVKEIVLVHNSDAIEELLFE